MIAAAAGDKAMVIDDMKWEDIKAIITEPGCAVELLIQTTQDGECDKSEYVCMRRIHTVSHVHMK
jgi:uncharacterized cupredoxin-like copper-binding protein